MSKKIGGYCQVRISLVKRLEDLKPDEQFALKGMDKRCIYNCNGYDYDCPKYKGEDINLRSSGE